MNYFFKIINKIKETHWKYIFNGSTVRIQGNSQIHKSVKIIGSYIYVDKSSSIIINKNARIEGVSIYVTNGGKVEIEDFSYLEKAKNHRAPEYIINSGELTVSDHVQLQCERLWIRYNGKVSIGKYTNINSGSEIRSDISVNIGAFCQISYHTRIWDTNTHCILPPDKRKELTVNHFPSFGYETERPSAKPVNIGIGCWLGEKATILKGVELGENVIVGYNTIVSNKIIPKNHTVVSKQKIYLKQYD